MTSNAWPQRVILSQSYIGMFLDVRLLGAALQRRSAMRTAGKGRLWRRPSGLDFDSFGDHQRIFKLDAEVPDSAVHLGVTQQQLDRP
jgi:hypothetical protein